MKKLLSLQNLILSLLIFSSCHYALAEDLPELVRMNASKSFLQLTNNSIDGIQKMYRDTINGNKDQNSAPKLEIVGSVKPPTQSESTNQQTNSVTNENCKLAIKVWFELTDGTYVNPSKKKWAKQERCYIHIEAAIPVFVSLFQNNMNQTTASTQIYPNDKYPESFKLIQPGQATRLPVIFQTDNNDHDEHLSLVFVRSDWSGFKDTSQRTEPQAVNNNGNIQVASQLTSSGSGTMKCVNDQIYSKNSLTDDEIRKNIKGNQNVSDEFVQEVTKSINDSVSSAKFTIVDAKQESSTQADNVCLYLLGTNYIGQWQFTITK